jgi:hypothetical protein
MFCLYLNGAEMSKLRLVSFYVTAQRLNVKQRLVVVQHQVTMISFETVPKMF